MIPGYGLRPRAAWRHAYGWSLKEAAERICDYAARSCLDPDGATVAETAPHLSEYENWPGPGVRPAGCRPTPYLLSLLAIVYECRVDDLLDLADHERMPAADRLILDRTTPGDVRRPVVRTGDHEQISAGLPGELAAWRQPAPGQRRQTTIPPWEPGLNASYVSDLLSLDLGNDPEIEDDPVRRRTFVGLTSTSLLSAIAGVSSGKRLLDTGPLVSVLAGHATDAGLEQPGLPSGLAALKSQVNHARCTRDAAIPR